MSTLRLLKSGWPTIAAMMGVTMSATNEATTAANASAMMNATAISTRFPFMMNALNSFSIGAAPSFDGRLGPMLASLVAAAQRLGEWAVPLRQDRVGLHLHEPPRVEEPVHHDHRARRTDVREHLAVRPPDLLPVAGVGQVGPRPHDVLRTGTGLGERGHDDLQHTPRLAERIRGRIAPVRHDRRGPGHDDVMALDHRAREPDHGFER